MGDASLTTPATLFTGCVTAETGSVNPRWNFLSFDNHNYTNVPISTPSASRYYMYSMDRGHCAKGTSDANVKVKGPHKGPDLLLIFFGAIKQHLSHQFPFQSFANRWQSVPRRRETFRNGSTVSKRSTKQQFPGDALLRNRFPHSSDFSIYYKHFFSTNKISPSD